MSKGPTTTHNVNDAAVPSAGTILLVEDTPSVRKLLTVILTQANFKVCEAKDGQEALDALTHMTPDIILSDISMPLMDGRELLTRVRAQSSSRSIPVLMLSADYDAEIERELIKLGASKLMTKVGSYTEMIATIRQIIGK